jgi:hypothetical protein
MSIDDLLAEFGRRQTGKPLALDANGICRIGFRGDDFLDIEPVPGSDHALVYAPLAPLPERNAGNVYGKLLAANLFGEATGGAWFAIDPGTEEILLNRRLVLPDLDADRFEALLLDFMDRVTHWKGELSGPDFDVLEGGEAAAAAPAAQATMVDPRFIIRG